MFTGIIQGTAEIMAIDEQANFRTHTLYFPPHLLSGLELGASVSHNGCCLTVTKIEDNKVGFDLIKETLRITNLGDLSIGSLVNLERAAKIGDEIGGHLMSGHIICTAEIVKILTSETNRQIWFNIPEHLAKYIVEKGFIGIDGMSLTIAEVIRNRFCVFLIPETLQRTTIGAKKLGQTVNIEIDVQTQLIVDTVERILAQNQ